MEFVKTIKSKKDFESTVISLLKSIEKSGWSIFGTYDIAERLNAKGFKHKNIKVIEICKGSHADNLLKRDKTVSICLPCRISVFEDSGINISIVKPTALSGIFSIPVEELEEIEKDLINIVSTI